jgi:hypothetical protein
MRELSPSGLSRCNWREANNVVRVGGFRGVLERARQQDLTPCADCLVTCATSPERQQAQGSLPLRLLGRRVQVEARQRRNHHPRGRVLERLTA